MSINFSMDGEVVNCFEDIFDDPALLDDEDYPHGEVQLLQLNVMNTEPCTSMARCSQTKHELKRKKEKS